MVMNGCMDRLFMMDEFLDQWIHALMLGDHIDGWKKGLMGE